MQRDAVIIERMFVDLGAKRKGDGNGSGPRIRRQAAILRRMGDPIKLVIFDYNGVLVDSERIAIHVDAAVLA